MLRLILLLFLMAGVAHSQTTTYTGTIKDLSLNVVTSGQVAFTLAQPVSSTIPGTGVFVPTTVYCNINADGSLSGYVAGVVSGSCIVASNTAISPSGTAYRICVQPYNTTPGSCFYDYATTSSKDITTVAPTLQTGPLNYNGVPGPPGPQGPVGYTVSCGTGCTVPGPFLSQSVNNVINPTVGFSGSTLDAWINAAQASASCTGAFGCTLSIPPASYAIVGQITVTNPNIRILGNGAILTGGPGITTMLYMSGKADSVEGVTFNLNGSTYGIVATKGTNQKSIRNTFIGNGGIYEQISGSPSGFLSDGDSFDGTVSGCAFANNLNVASSANVNITNSRILDTCGFSTEIVASNQVTVSNQIIRQDSQQQTVIATSGQATFMFNWPSTTPTVQRVWMLVNGVPTTATSVTYTSALVTTVVMPAQTLGASVTALGWTALENIQVNSQSFNTIIEGNTIDGGGDAGIDVVSDYHMIQNGSQTATNNQQVFTITASPGITAVALPMVNGRVLAPNQATIANSGSVYTISLASPVPVGTVVYLEDFVNNQPGSIPADYPAGSTIQNNGIKQVASSCIAPEIGAQGVVIQGNTVSDCGMGVPTAAYSSGIFTGNAQVAVKNNVISNTRAVPTMNAGISVQCAGCETGVMEKTQLIDGNTYIGAFPIGKLYIPALFSRQSGIDVSEGVTIPYPEQPNFDQPGWSSAPPNSHYFTYTYTVSGATRNTSSVIGGVASASIPSGTYLSITPSNQIFFFNSLMRVTFWAQVTSGSPIVSLYSSFTNPPSGTVASTNISLSGYAWKQYSIYASMVGMDTPPNIYLRADGTNGAFNIQNITFSATPVATGATTGTGTSSAVLDQKYVDSLKVGSGGAAIAGPASVSGPETLGGSLTGTQTATFANGTSVTASCTSGFLCSQLSGAISISVSATTTAETLVTVNLPIPAPSNLSCSFQNMAGMNNSSFAQAAPYSTSSFSAYYTAALSAGTYQFGYTCQ